MAILKWKARYCVVLTVMVFDSLPSYYLLLILRSALHDLLMSQYFKNETNHLKRKTYHS